MAKRYTTKGKPTSYYRIENGKKVYLTDRAVKEYIMRANGWTAEQYRKQYDLFKNKLRAYESYQRAQGVNEKPQSVIDVLFKEAKSKRAYGKDYTPSMKMQQIRGFSAVSITKGRQLATQEKYLAKQDARYSSYINKRFSDFIKANKGAQAIVDAFKSKGGRINYAKLEKALSDYANKVHASIKESGKVEDGQAIASSETYGSDIVEDFDISSYLD